MQPTLAELRELAGKARAVPKAVPTGGAKGANDGPQDESEAPPAAGVKPKKRKAQPKSVITTDEDEEEASPKESAHKKTRRAIPKKPQHVREAEKRKKEQQEKDKRAAQAKAAVKARNLTADRIAPNEICGHSNFQGCTR